MLENGEVKECSKHCSVGCSQPFVQDAPLEIRKINGGIEDEKKGFLHYRSRTCGTDVHTRCAGGSKRREECGGFRLKKGENTASLRGSPDGKYRRDGNLGA